MDKDSDQKTYRTGGYQQRNRNQNQQQNQQRTVELLPAPEVLESYNYVVEGSAKMILQMFETEQKHRHEWEQQALKTHTFSTLLGQVLGFLIAVAIFTSAAVIGIYGNSTVASFIWVFGMAIVVMAGLVWAYAKQMGQRPLFARPTMRTHFRPVKRSQHHQD